MISVDIIKFLKLKEHDKQFFMSGKLYVYDFDKCDVYISDFNPISDDRIEIDTYYVLFSKDKCHHSMIITNEFIVGCIDFKLFVEDQYNFFRAQIKERYNKDI